MPVMWKQRSVTPALNTTPAHLTIVFSITSVIHVHCFKSLYFTWHEFWKWFYSFRGKLARFLNFLAEETLFKPYQSFMWLWKTVMVSEQSDSEYESKHDLVKCLCVYERKSTSWLRKANTFLTLSLVWLLFVDILNSLEIWLPWTQNRDNGRLVHVYFLNSLPVLENAIQN